MQKRITKRYRNALNALYGNGEIKPSKPKRKPQQTERLHQMMFNKWFDLFATNKDIRWFHPANGGSRNPIEGVNLKRSGVKKGVPDIVIPVASRGYHGLVIELKKHDGKMSDLSPEQKDWLNWFRRQNWKSCVAFGFEEAKQFTELYFSCE